jgi:hypothetical protein
MAADQALDLYRQLADWYEQQGQAQMRDRFLVLAADAALLAKHPETAERFRARLLQQNPHHLLKPYATFAEAMKAPDVQSYVADLRRTYSPETASHLLHSLRSVAEPAPPAPAPPPPSAQPEELPGLEPLPEGPEVLQFFRIDQELEEIPEPVKQRQAPAARPAPKPAPAPIPLAPEPPARKPVPAPPPVPRSPKPPRSPAVSPYAVERPRPARREREDEEPTDGAWVALGLFVLVLLAGLALAAYTLVRPFLPAGWF